MPLYRQRCYRKDVTYHAPRPEEKLMAGMPGSASVAKASLTSAADAADLKSAFACFRLCPR
jgi:hypothetical protein